MRTESEIRKQIEKVEPVARLPWWEEDSERAKMVIDTLLWVLGDESGGSIDFENVEV